MQHTGANSFLKLLFEFSLQQQFQVVPRSCATPYHAIFTTAPFWIGFKKILSLLFFRLSFPRFLLLIRSLIQMEIVLSFLSWYTSRTTDTQWRHKSKISEKLGRCGRQNMLPPYLRIWDWDWIFGRAVKAISSLGVRSPWYTYYVSVARKLTILECGSKKVQSKLFWSMLHFLGEHKDSIDRGTTVLQNCLAPLWESGACALLAKNG